MLTIEEENKIRCILSGGTNCECKVALEQIFKCRLFHECEYFSLLKSCFETEMAVEANKQYRREYPNGI